MNIYKKFTVILLYILLISTVRADLVQYNFDIDTKIVNFTGKDIKAISINNQIPGPTIEATVGDTLEVTFSNKMDTETSIHWHGILLPNDQDGVPYLTTKPIAANSSFTYKYAHSTMKCNYKSSGHLFECLYRSLKVEYFSRSVIQQIFNSSNILV
jgi:hypothetical protein